ncbi:MAG: hypothetical protein LBV17_00420 [Treponema sp.]|jgi:hypothetical protein|nr:hypothetical protein [Treponema sp.]
MRGFAKLSILFTLTFFIFLLLSAGIRFLGLRVEWAQNLPPKPETSLTLLIAAVHWALSLTMHISILLSLSYGARRQYFPPMVVITVTALSLLFHFGISSALYQWKNVPSAVTAVKPVGEKGLILSNKFSRNETAVILLKGPAEPLGPRVTAIPDQPLQFIESTSNASLDLPPIPFGDNTPWFLKSVSIDLKLSEDQIFERFLEGRHSYFIYVGALIFLMSSLGFAIKFSVWPLADLFLGVLAFRGILAVEIFLNTPEMREIISSFLNNTVPVFIAVPAVFFGFGALINVYAILVYVIKRRKPDDF